MTTLWQNAVGMLSNAFEAAGVNETVKICRDADTGTMSAAFGNSKFEIADASGAILEWISEDILCNASDYKIGDQITKPKRGDKVLRTLPNGDLIYLEVHQPSVNQRPYTVSCQDLRLRIHCKRVSS